MTRQDALAALLSDPAALEHIALRLAFTVCPVDDVPTITDALREALTALGERHKPMPYTSPADEMAQRGYDAARDAKDAA